MNKIRLEHIFFELVAAMTWHNRESIGLVKELYDEILRYKDIEEKFGIDLVMLVKALEDGIYVRHNYANGKYEIKHVGGVRVNGHGRIIYYDEDCQAERCVKISEYGKTWALTKEVIE